MTGPAPWLRRLRENADRVRDAPLEPLAERLGYQRDPRRRQRWRRDSRCSASAAPSSSSRLRPGRRRRDRPRHACPRLRVPRGPRLPRRRSASGPGRPASRHPHQRPAPARPRRRKLATRARLPDQRPRPRPGPAGTLPPSRHALRRPPPQRRLHLPRPRRLHRWRRTRRHLPAPRRLHLQRPRPRLPPRPRRLLAEDRPPAAVLLTESAIDALSAVLLPAPGLPPDCLVASTAGTARRLPRWLHGFPHSRILCGYDADPAGEQAARDLLRRHPGLSRLRPQHANDWNDRLRLPTPQTRS